MALSGLFHSGSPQSPAMPAGPLPSVNTHKMRTTKLLRAAIALTRTLLLQWRDALWTSPDIGVKGWALRPSMISSFKHSHIPVLFNHFFNIMPKKLWHLGLLWYYRLASRTHSQKLLEDFKHTYTHTAILMGSFWKKAEGKGDWDQGEGRTST